LFIAELEQLRAEEARIKEICVKGFGSMLHKDEVLAMVKQLFPKVCLLDNAYAMSKSACH